jgi:hypothetical protein
VIGVEKPPPPFFQFGISGTSFAPLAGLRNQGYFSPATKHRVAVILTDGESGPFDPAAMKQSLLLSPTTGAFPGRPIPSVEAPVSLLVVRVGNGTDRIYDSARRVEAAYRPDPHAVASVDSLAFATRGHAVTAANLSAASATLKQMTGSGRTSLQGMNTKTIALAPYVVLLAFAPLALVLRRRNLTSI